MARFFVSEDQVGSNEVVLQASDAQHLVKALRKRVGDEVEVCLAGRAYQATLISLTKEEAIVALGNPLPESESPLTTHLYQSLPKSDKMDLVVQKATELGVSVITPVLTDRVIARPKPSALEERQRRWQRIAYEAAKQSRRTLVPEVRPVVDLGEIRPNDGAVRLVAWEEGQAPLRVALQRTETLHIDLFIGPEGGLTQREVSQLEFLGFRQVSLGPRILRTETAPLLLLGLVQYQLGDIGG